MLAVEADPWLASVLRDSVALRGNQDLAVEVLCAAVGDAAGISKFCIARAGRASNFLREAGGRAIADGTQYEVPVVTVTLDSLLSAYALPDFVKIDVESAEWLVLQGAERLIEDVKPAIYVEVDQENVTRVTALLHDASYPCSKGNTGGHNEPIEHCCNNTIAIHASKVEAFQRRSSV